MQQDKLGTYWGQNRACCPQLKQLKQIFNKFNPYISMRLH